MESTARACRGKTGRAEPVQMLFAAGPVRLAGMFSELEDQLAGMTTGGDYSVPDGRRTAPMQWCGADRIDAS
jgi:phage terminase large subunit-like protein